MQPPQERDGPIPVGERLGGGRVLKVPRAALAANVAAVRIPATLTGLNASIRDAARGGAQYWVAQIR